MPTNFRSYEAQSRLLAAVVATTKARLDFKALSQYMGSDTTPAMVDHRTRHIKKLAQLQEQWVQGGKDPKDLPCEEKEIQKLFGESTAAGLEFHFREVKATGKAQKALADKGEDTSKVAIHGPKARTSNAVPSTPGSRKRAASTKTPAKTPSTKGTGRSNKRQRVTVSGDENSVDEDYDQLDMGTPSRNRKNKIPASNPAYTVNNSSTSGAENSDVPARGNTRPENPSTLLFGNGVINTTVTGAPAPERFMHSANNGSTTVANDDDEIMEIDGSQFSAKGTQQSQHSVPASAPEQIIKLDPFDDEPEEGYLDLTSQPVWNGDA
ncbi:hypothetical protein BJ170DRAFT_687600 [Xylariales sp. AK1849]|nr:hypothetical protein BJ170DRAFT_687600 [Xylariales sp. AK1849]